MRRRCCAAASVALHLAVIMPWPHAAAKPKSEPKVAIGPHYQPPMRFREQDVTSTTGLACSHNYDGVGFEHTWDGRVIAVAKGGPAWRYGVRIGHKMLSYAHGDGEMTFEFEIAGAKVRKRIPTGDICQDEA